MRKAPILFLLTGGLLVGTVPFASGQDLSYMGSVEYAAGSYYFTERTASLYLNNGMMISGHKGTVSLSVPLISQNTPWTSYTGATSGPRPTGGPRSGMVDGGGQGQGKQRGKGQIDLGSTDSVSFVKTHVGDPSVNAQLALYSSGMGRTNISGTVDIKIPFTDPDSGFGTGAWDVGAGLSWSQQLTNTTLMVLGGSYWWLGDMDDLEFNDILSYHAAVGQHFIGGKLMATANLFGSTRFLNGIDPPINAGIGLGLQATSRILLNTHLLFGLSESTSEISMGLGWSIKL